MRHMASSNLFMFYSAVVEPIVVFAGMQLLLLLSTAAATTTVKPQLIIFEYVSFKIKRVSVKYFLSCNVIVLVKRPLIITLIYLYPSMDKYCKVWDAIGYPFPNFNSQPLKFCNEYVISSHTLMGMWALKW